MRIIMVSHLYPSRVDSVRGSFVHRQVLALRERNLDVEVIAPSPLVPFPLGLFKGKWRNYSRIPNKDMLDGVPVDYPRVIRTPGAVMFQYAGRAYLPVLRRRICSAHSCCPADIIHAQVGYPDGWAAAQVAYELGLPLVTTFHGQELQIIVKKSLRLNKLIQHVMEQSAALVVPSSKMKKLALDWGMSAERLHLVPNGFDTVTGASLPEAIQSKLSGKKIILCVANLIEQKGIQHVLLAVAALKDKIPNLVCVVVGDGPYLSALQHLSRRQGIHDRVVFAGQVSPKKLGGYYQAADVFALPARDEAFGIVYLEALAAGLPVIGCRGEGIIPSAVEAGVASAVPWADPASVARQLVQALNQSLPDKGLAEGFLSKYSWQANAAKMESIYRAVAKGGKQ